MFAVYKTIYTMTEEQLDRLFYFYLFNTDKITEETINLLMNTKKQ